MVYDNECKSLYIFPTFNCNLKCIHCWASASSDACKEKLSVQDIIAVIEEADEYNLRTIKFTGGEPLLEKNTIIQVLEYLLQKDKKYYITIETNGTLLDEKIIELFQKLDVEVCISLHNVDPNKHDTFVGKIGAYEMLMKNIKLLNGVKHKQIMTSIGKHNLNDLQDIVKFGVEHDIKTFKFNVLVPVGRGKKLDSLLSSKEILQVNTLAKELKEKYKDIIIITSIPFCLENFNHEFSIERITTTSSCDFLHTANLLPNGDVSMCAWSKLNSNSELYLGNIHSTEFCNIWSKSKAIKEKVNCLKGVCGNCILKSACGGSCRAMAYYSYGELNSPLPLCQMLYEDGVFPKNKLINPQKKLDGDF